MRRSAFAFAAGAVFMTLAVLTLSHGGLPYKPDAMTWPEWISGVAFVASMAALFALLIWSGYNEQDNLGK